MSYANLFTSWLRNEIEPALRCEWADGLEGHCFGDVEHVVAGPVVYGHEYDACRRHHNLVVRRWHPKVPVR